jgi:hypothetical protein
MSLGALEMVLQMGHCDQSEAALFGGSRCESLESLSELVMPKMALNIPLDDEVPLSDDVDTIVGAILLNCDVVLLLLGVPPNLSDELPALFVNLVNLSMAQLGPGRGELGPGWGELGPARWDLVLLREHLDFARGDLGPALGDLARRNMGPALGDLVFERRELDFARRELDLARRELDLARGELDIARRGLGHSRGEVGHSRGVLGVLGVLGPERLAGVVPLCCGDLPVLGAGPSFVYGVITILKKCCSRPGKGHRIVIEAPLFGLTPVTTLLAGAAPVFLAPGFLLVGLPLLVGGLLLPGTAFALGPPLLFLLVALVLTGALGAGLFSQELITIWK